MPDQTTKGQHDPAYAEPADYGAMARRLMGMLYPNAFTISPIDLINQGARAVSGDLLFPVERHQRSVRPWSEGPQWKRAPDLYYPPPQR